VAERVGDKRQCTRSFHANWDVLLSTLLVLLLRRFTGGCLVGKEARIAGEADSSGRSNTCGILDAQCGNGDSRSAGSDGNGGGGGSSGGVCQVVDGFLRHSVVPSCYRKLLPTAFKSHISHDVVLMCLMCHRVRATGATWHVTAHFMAHRL
jgi:hypothetical protein